MGSPQEAFPFIVCVSVHWPQGIPWDCSDTSLCSISLSIKFVLLFFFLLHHHVSISLWGTHRLFPLNYPKHMQPHTVSRSPALHLRNSGIIMQKEKNVWDREKLVMNKFGYDLSRPHINKQDAHSQIFPSTYMRIYTYRFFALVCPQSGNTDPAHC